MIKKQIKDNRGRPLDLSKNIIILQATLDLLAESSFDSLTMEAVAEKAKVGKGTIYRRWNSKTELVLETAFYMSRIGASDRELSSNNSLREQLIEMLNLYFLNDGSKYQKAMATICSEASHNIELEKGLNNTFYQVYKEAFMSIISPFEFKDDKDLKIDIDILADIGPALMVYRNFLNISSLSSEYIERVVDHFLMPMLNSLLDFNNTK